MMYRSGLVLVEILMMIVGGVVVYSSDLPELDIKEITLKNGLKMVCVKRSFVPSVSFQVWYKVGAIDDPPSRSGMAHFLEHMMFKETKNLKPGQFSLEVRKFGGSENAGTSFDYTTYYIDLSTKFLEKAFKLEAERMQNLVISEKEFNSEKNVVLEERKMRYEDDPEGFFFEKILHKAFPLHPYGRPVIGWEADIKNIEPEDMKKFYDEYYSPANLLIVIVGDVDFNRVKALGEKYFAGINKPSKKTPEHYPNRKPLKGIVEFSVEKEGNTEMVGIVVPTPDITHKDMPALTVLETAMIEGRSSIFEKNLVYQKRVASVIYGWINLSRDPSGLFLFGVPSEGVKVGTLKDEMLNLLKEIAQKGVSEDNFTRSKNQILASKYYEMERNHDLASMLGWSFAVAGDYRFGFEFIERTKKVSISDVNEVAKKYLGSGDMVVGILRKK